MKLNRSSFIITGAMFFVALMILGFAPVTLVDEEAIGEIGSKVVPFELPTYDGSTITADNLAGKVTLLVFWFPT